MTTHSAMGDGERDVLEHMLDVAAVGVDRHRCWTVGEQARRRLVPSLTTPLSLLKTRRCGRTNLVPTDLDGREAADCDGYSERDTGTFAVTTNEP